MPVFNEEANIPVLVERTRNVLEAAGVDYEFLFIDDGSRDKSLEVITEMAGRDSNIKALSLSRNFGSHAAISAGLDHASGDAAVILAADLQDPPEVIPEFLAKLEEGYEVVWGVRKTNESSRRRLLANRFFYGLVRSIALPGYPKEGTGSFCLLSRPVIEALRRFPEKQRVTFGLIWWTGFKQTFVPYERVSRLSGQSGWSQRRLVNAAIDVLTTYSYKPLRWITYAGVAAFIISLLMILYLFLSWIIKDQTMAGWTSLMAAIFLFGGLQMIMLGVVGEYLWRIAVEVRQRPLYIVAKKVNLDD